MKQLHHWSGDQSVHVVAATMFCTTKENSKPKNQPEMSGKYRSYFDYYVQRAKQLIPVKGGIKTRILK